MSATRRFVFLIPLFCLGANFLCPAFGFAAADDECGKVRKQYALSGQRLYYEDGSAIYPFPGDPRRLAEFVRRNTKDHIRFIYYVEFEAERQPPMFSVIQRFITKADSDNQVVRTYNNIRRHPLPISFDEYQDFHQRGDDPKKHHGLMEWFELGPGFFTHRDLVNTSVWQEPRKFLAISDPHLAEEQVRSYLIAMKGVREGGSCLPFDPYVSPSSERLSFIIRDLRATETGDYPDPFEATVDLTQ